MPSEPSLAVDWEGLAVAFESRSKLITHFFDRETGDVVQVLERDAELHAAMSRDSRFAAVPRDRGERSRGDLEEFAGRCEEAACRRDLTAALAVDDFAAAYRTALLQHPKEEAHFFQFKERRARERGREWLTALGVAVDQSRKT